MNSRNVIPVACLTGIALCVTSVAAAADLVELRAFPPEISLQTSKDRQSVVVQAVYADGVTRDVTDVCEWSFADGSVVGREANVLRPTADGQTQLTVSFEGQSAQVPIVVAEAAAPRPVSFKLDVMPIFMKASCNSGSCHGAARGKDGFMLSLFGYDPDGDHFRITRAQPGRRIDLAVPASSLIVEKATGAVPHTGGKLFDVDSPMGRDLVEWIASATPADPADIPVCTELELYPRQAVMSGAGTTQRVTVLARYSDGSTRDVTGLALMQSNNATSAEISPEGIVTAGARGEAFVMARYDTHTVVSQYIVLPDGLQYEEAPVEPVNYVDELVADKLRKL
ncbi:MAG: cell surface protein, partial [Planctomycetaceae bacterium]|nr:cell surface protein [Planctomycetaceae bacterium]